MRDASQSSKFCTGYFVVSKTLFKPGGGGQKRPPIGFSLSPQKWVGKVANFFTLAIIWRGLNHFLRLYFAFGSQEGSKDKIYPHFHKLEFCPELEIGKFLCIYISSCYLNWNILVYWVTTIDLLGPGQHSAK